MVNIGMKGDAFHHHLSFVQAQLILFKKGKTRSLTSRLRHVQKGPIEKKEGHKPQNAEVHACSYSSAAALAWPGATMHRACGRCRSNGCREQTETEDRATQTLKGPSQTGEGEQPSKSTHSISTTLSVLAEFFLWSSTAVFVQSKRPFAHEDSKIKTGSEQLERSHNTECIYHLWQSNTEKPARRNALHALWRRRWKINVKPCANLKLDRSSLLCFPQQCEEKSFTNAFLNTEWAHFLFTQIQQQGLAGFKPEAASNKHSSDTVKPVNTESFNVDERL